MITNPRMQKLLMKRIGIYGGAFNPPHNGHVNAAREVIEKLGLDELVVVPTKDPPHKPLPEGSPSPEERLEMARIAFEGLEHVSVSDVEIKRDGPSYTADTLRELRGICPNAEFWLVTGADMFLSLQQWKRPEEILSGCGVCALMRREGELEKLLKHAEFLEERFGARCIVLENAVYNISSTEVRRALATGRAEGLVPDRLLEHIKVKGLYNGYNEHG